VDLIHILFLFPDCGKYVLVTTAWRVLPFGMEKRSADMESGCEYISILVVVVFVVVVVVVVVVVL